MELGLRAGLAKQPMENSPPTRRLAMQVAPARAASPAARTATRFWCKPGPRIAGVQPVDVDATWVVVKILVP